MQANDTVNRVTEYRAACYRLFSAAFCLPNEDFFVPGDVRDFSVLLSDLGSDAAEPVNAMADVLDGTSANELKIEYSRLFVGPFALPAPPYGSVYLDDGHRLMGDSTVDVVRRYREVDIQMDPVQQDVPDHIAVELEFMAYLLHLEQVAVENGDDAAAREERQRQESFLHKHLCAWVPTFTEKVEEDTDSGFYRELARAVNLFLAEDLARISGARNGS